jgi:hypothetical protein
LKRIVINSSSQIPISGVVFRFKILCSGMTGVEIGINADHE